MSVHIIIDGYNLIRQSDALSSLDNMDIQLGRDALIDMLAAYKKIKGHKITVVFDGINAPLYSQKNNRIKGIDIKFSNQGEQADNLIKRMAKKDKERAVIVSSDQDIINYSIGQRASTIASPEFEDKITMAAYMLDKGVNEDRLTGWVPTTKKKGPKRRRTKRKRRNHTRLNKL